MKINRTLLQLLFWIPTASVFAADPKPSAVRFQAGAATSNITPEIWGGHCWRVCSVALNGYYGYLPTPRHFELGGYET
jgi:hypothetical protein